MASKKGPHRKPGPRYPSGKLKPAGPNPRVVELRRLLLGAKPGDKVDITRAENALDLAHARGWLSTARRQGADRYATLVRRVLVDLPTVRVAKPLASMKAPSALVTTDDGIPRSGVATEADIALQKSALDLEAGKITEREYARAEKAHRMAKIDWSRVPAADLVKVFDAIMDATPTRPITPNGDAGAERLERDRSALRAIWTRLSPEEAKELFSTCVLGSWPQWVVYRAQGIEPPRGWDRKRLLLESGLDRVLEALDEREPLPADDPHDAPRLKSAPKHEEHFQYVDTAGNPLFEVVKRTSRKAGGRP